MSRIVETEHGKVRRLDLLDVMLIFVQRKWLILGWALAGLVIAIIAIIRVPTLYKAEATIMPPQQEQSSAALLSQIGALTAIAGVGSNLGLKNPADLYIAILQTNLVADSIVDRFHLEDVYHIPDRDGAAGRLRKRSKFVANKTGLIQVTVEDGDPKRAVALVNGYADELFRQNNRLAIGSASQRRQFYEQQLAQEKDRLADAEVAMKKTQIATGVLQVSGQAQNIILEEANVQANITAHEVQLGALLASSTEQNPDVIRLRTELAGLREQLNKMQHGTNGAMLSQREFPEAGLEYIRRERDVQYHQALFDLLARQLEAARIDEAKASPSVQMVDPPLLPRAKSWPKPFLFILIGLVVGTMFGCIRATMIYLYNYADTDPGLRDRYAQIKQAMRFRRS
ncbi:MAG TPA: Wzz/FepE/Etk N-terminal domain-containing protein [Acidobacteriaceae bacterium]